MRVWIAITLMCFSAWAAVAQETSEEDKGRITRYLEDTLSGLGREVRIDGFRGALSSRVSMERMTIADDEGVWLTLTDAVLDWNRAAILRGEINIDQISASRIEVARLPKAGEEAASPEASGGFSLPELPVSIDIKSLSAKEVTLGETVIGIPVNLRLDGAVTLAAGQGQAALEIERLKGPRGVFSLNASYANSTRQLTLDLVLDEASEGIVATLLNLPGRPALELSVTGDAPLDDFTADIALNSAGQPRLAGRVSTRIESVAGDPALETQEPPRIIWVDIAGDLAPLFAPQYRRFFGDDVAMKSLVRLFPDGRVVLEDLRVQAAALLLEGDAALAAGGLPQRFRLNGLLEDPEQAAVILPLTGPETRVRRAQIAASFDSSKGDTWTVDADLDQFDRPGIAVQRVQITAKGDIRNSGTPEVTARIDAAAEGIGLADEALAAALGDAVGFGGNLAWRAGEPLDLSDVRLVGEGMVVTGAGKVDGLDSAGKVDGAFEAQIGDLARFSLLARRPLSGALAAKLSGTAAMLTGAFDLDLTAAGRDLTVGIEKADAALVGQSDLAVSVRRDETGLTLRSAEMKTAAVSARADGSVTSEQTHFGFEAALDDLGRLVEGIAGPAELEGEATRHDTGWLVDLALRGPYQSTAEGRLAVPDDGEPSVKLSGAIGNVGAILPDLAGSARFDAIARQQGESWAIDTSGQGPGGSTFAVAGTVRTDASEAELKIGGTVPLAMANRRLNPIAVQGMVLADLRLSGPLAVSALSGTLSTSGARVSLPSLQNALTGIDAMVNLAGQSAAIRTSAGLATGGRIVIEGQVGTQAPYTTSLGVQVLDAVIRDPRLFETVARGNLIVGGTAPAGLNITGRINLDRTEIRVPSSGLAGGSIPEIEHVGERAGVRQTRRHAGLLKNEAEANGRSGGIAVGLDVLIAADSRVFVRGRGLDAELGGRFRVTGTTAGIIPVGGFDLIRGRLDILGKRLTLDEGIVRLQGDFVPGLRLVASTVSDDDTIVRIIIEGRADQPDVSFVSEPELPDDEVLARLLFGRELGSLSAFQALQLASAVATLAGRGGTGLAEQIRQTTGLDDLNVGTDTEGNTTVGVGKYISDNVYTDVQVGDQSNTEINLNIDLSRRTKLRGSFGTDGGTGVGIFFEKDY